MLGMHVHLEDEDAEDHQEDISSVASYRGNEDIHPHSRGLFPFISDIVRKKFNI